MTRELWQDIFAGAAAACATGGLVARIVLDRIAKRARPDPEVIRTKRHCAVDGCQIRVAHSHTEALLRRIREK